jgi:hypothetical protein
MGLEEEGQKQGRRTTRNKVDLIGELEAKKWDLGDVDQVVQIALNILFREFVELHHGGDLPAPPPATEHSTNKTRGEAQVGTRVVPMMLQIGGHRVIGNTN